MPKRVTPPVYFVDLSEDVSDDLDENYTPPPLKKYNSESDIPPARSSFFANKNVLAIEDETPRSIELFNQAFKDFTAKVTNLDKVMAGEILSQLADIFHSKKMYDLIKSVIPSTEHRKLGQTLPWLFFTLYNEAAQLGNTAVQEKLTALRKEIPILKKAPAFKNTLALDAKSVKAFLLKSLENHAEEIHTLFPTAMQVILSNLLYKIGAAFDKKLIPLEGFDRHEVAHIFIHNAAQLEHANASKWSNSYVNKQSGKLRP